MQKTRQRTLAGRASPAGHPPALDVREFYYPQHPGAGGLCPVTTDYVWGQPLGYGACALPGAASTAGFQPRYAPCAGAHPQPAAKPQHGGSCEGVAAACVACLRATAADGCLLAA